jgi:WD40 repeat protein
LSNIIPTNDLSRATTQTRSTTATLFPATAIPTPLDQVVSRQFAEALAVVWSPRGDTIAVTTNNALLLLDAEDLETRISLPIMRGEPSLLAIDPKGERAAAFDGPTLRVWSVDTGRELAARNGFITGAFLLAFADDGTLFVGELYGGGSTGVFPLSPLFEEQEGRAGASLTDQEFNFDDPATISPDGRILAIAQAMHRILLFGPESSQEPYRTINVDSVVEMSFAPDGSTLVILDTKCNLELIRLTDGQLVREFAWCQPPMLEQGTYGLTISEDGRRFAAAGNNGSLGVWDLSSGDRLLKAAIPARYRNNLSFAPTGDMLASLGEDGLLQVWRIEN